ncbi:hypothetical protein HanRHA438_Chr10g0473051 [Helianthus annuus]|uniref:Uncharacterized protein n=2 Tax=Helianthus annuus TaxID=4232 RepID=A0A9K3HM37_HELAN|nr:hypothetical protein HanXRQr2_Chr11g0478291 [Helianthus annuus]KAJ0500675.1 hypothetical protein HanHA300_Chr11g0392071 [Helianthus annuus]KAJ0508263.1 hypothetical protein HanIR_Chr11g0515291 [Helianthus annuus]KAJ0516555.1 hypothetical protein HanHA89_Chr11g0415121 [Helianthus annuus]KAJ0688498.1 hypothetical protein HanOQP8_Chr11g0394961 [Helianthus annuus]
MKETENIVTSTEVEHVVLNSGKLDNSVDAVESSKEAPADENDTNDNNETDESDAFESKLRIGFSNGMQSYVQGVNRTCLSEFSGISGVHFDLMMIRAKAQLKS